MRRSCRRASHVRSKRRETAPATAARSSSVPNTPHQPASSSPPDHPQHRDFPASSFDRFPAQDGRCAKTGALDERTRLSLQADQDCYRASSRSPFLRRARGSILWTAGSAHGPDRQAAVAPRTGSSFCVSLPLCAVDGSVDLELAEGRSVLLSEMKRRIKHLGVELGTLTDALVWRARVNGTVIGPLGHSMKTDTDWSSGFSTSIITRPGPPSRWDTILGTSAVPAEMSCLPVDWTEGGPDSRKPEAHNKPRINRATISVPHHGDPQHGPRSQLQ